jgi:hypothetical protein
MLNHDAATALAALRSPGPTTRYARPQRALVGCSLLPRIRRPLSRLAPRPEVQRALATATLTASDMPEYAYKPPYLGVSSCPPMIQSIMLT